MLRGPSGGGKTTLLNILGTIDLPTSGRVGALCRMNGYMRFIFSYASYVESSRNIGIPGGCKLRRRLFGQIATGKNWIRFSNIQLTGHLICV